MWKSEDGFKLNANTSFGEVEILKKLFLIKQSDVIKIKDCITKINLVSQVSIKGSVLAYQKQHVTTKNCDIHIYIIADESGQIKMNSYPSLLLSWKKLHYQRCTS